MENKGKLLIVDDETAFLKITEYYVFKVLRR
jgi:hypothetical protein